MAPCNPHQPCLSARGIGSSDHGATGLLGKHRDAAAAGARRYWRPAPTNPKDDHRQKLPSAKQCEAIFANRKHHGRDSAETVPANQQRTQHEADNGKRDRKLFQRVLVSIARRIPTSIQPPSRLADASEQAPPSLASVGIRRSLPSALRHLGGRNARSSTGHLQLVGGRMRCGSRSNAQRVPPWSWRSTRTWSGWSKHPGLPSADNNSRCRPSYRTRVPTAIDNPERVDLARYQRLDWHIRRRPRTVAHTMGSLCAEGVNVRFPSRPDHPLARPPMVRSGAKPEAADLQHELLLSADSRRSRADFG
jgi:hypothetical protein